MFCEKRNGHYGLLLHPNSEKKNKKAWSENHFISYQPKDPPPTHNNTTSELHYSTVCCSRIIMSSAGVCVCVCVECVFPVLQQCDIVSYHTLGCKAVVLSGWGGCQVNKG